MKALVVTPSRKDSARLAELPEPSTSEGSILVQMIAIGVCGTDREIIEGLYGWPPPRQTDLILGHESLGTVLEAPHNSGFKSGDRVVGIVRHPDPVPCENCAVLEWDMCKNGLYTERGIKERNGFCSDRYRLEPEFAVKTDSGLNELGVLLEPASVVAKAWDHIQKIGQRALFRPKRVLITGAGPIGLLASLMARQRGYEIHVVDRAQEGEKPRLIKDLGGHYYNQVQQLTHLNHSFDIAIECTGVGSLVLDVMCTAGPNSIVCLTGVSSGGRKVEFDIGGLNRSMVLENTAVFGSVNANRHHYEMGARSLAEADRRWLSRLITRRVPLNRWQEALEKNSRDIKVILVPAEK